MFNKRIISVLVALVMVLAMMSPAMADATSDFSFIIHTSKTSVELGDTFSVRLIIKSNLDTEFDIYTMQDYIGFDPELVQVDPASIVTPSGFNATLQKNRIFVNRYGITPVEADVTFTALTFECTAIADGEVDFTHSVVEMVGENLVAYSVDAEEASVILGEVIVETDGYPDPEPEETEPEETEPEETEPEETEPEETEPEETEPEETEPEETEPSEPHVCPSAAYADVDQTLWYHEAIDYAVVEGLMNGVDATAFAPDGTTTRAMIATILWRLEGSPIVDFAHAFTDVADGTWYAEAVRWAAANGIVKGITETTFVPDDFITREQFAAMIYRYEQYKGGDVAVAEGTALDFTDVADISDWAYDAIVWCNVNKIINGMGDGTLAPKGNATRAQAAQILKNYCEK